MISRTLRKYFSTSAKNIPLIDMSQYIHQRGDFKKECEKVALSLRNYGCCIVKDHYFREEHNDEFMDLMERYFNDRAIKSERNAQLEDFFPEHGYQAGLMKEYMEIPLDYQSVVSKLTQDNKPRSGQPPKPDAKWRFFWRVGSTLSDTSETVKLPKFIPKDFPEFSFVMDRTSNLLLDCIYNIAKMAAIGFGLEKDCLTSMLVGGSHILGPTGSDLEHHNPGDVFSGFHCDFNLLTAHGASRYPGLTIWTKGGEKVEFSMPKDYVLIQAGKQLEYLTGGEVQAGFHEAFYSEKAAEIKEKKKAEGMRDLWRVSSTMFAYTRQDIILEPLPLFKNADSARLYPPTPASNLLLERVNSLKRK